MSRLFQRAGRSGWYLGVSVPKSLRKKLGKNEVHKKVGNTHAEARINKSRVEAEIPRSFGVELKSLSLVEGVTPFIIYEITRHSITGMSDVLKVYTRPSIDELRDAMELI